MRNLLAGKALPPLLSCPVSTQCLVLQSRHRLVYANPLTTLCSKRSYLTRRRTPFNLFANFEGDNSTIWRSRMARFDGGMPSLVLVTRALASLVLVVFLPFAGAQQQSDGSNNLPAFGSFSGSDFDIVSLQNGNVHISIPILSVPQRGGKPIKYMFLFDTPDFSKTLYSPAQGSPYWLITRDAYYEGWFLSNTLNWGSYTEWENTQYTCPDSDIKYTLSTVGIIDPEHAKHPFYLLNSTAPCFPAQLVAPALDGSGMLLNYGTNGTGLLLKDGTRASIEDTNGNLFSTTADTLGRNLLTVTNGPTITLTTPLGIKVTGTQYETLTYTDPNGKSQAWTLDYEAIDVNTAALCPTGVIKCFGGGGAAQIVPQYLYLPTGAYYTFAYNDDSSGELQQIVLPTGGSISYTYSGYRCIANPLVP